MQYAHGAFPNVQHRNRKRNIQDSPKVSSKTILRIQRTVLIGGTYNINLQISLSTYPSHGLFSRIPGHIFHHSPPIHPNHSQTTQNHSYPDADLILVVSLKKYCNHTNEYTKNKS